MEDEATLTKQTDLNECAVNGDKNRPYVYFMVLFL